MLEPQKMDRVLIVGTKDVLEPTIQALHDMNLLHVEDYLEEEEYFHIGKPLPVVTSLSEKLLKLRSIKSYLGTRDIVASRSQRGQILKDVEANLAQLEGDVTKKMAEKGAVESELKELGRREELLKPYEALGLPLELLGGYESVAVYTGAVPGDVEPAVRAVTPDYELFSAPYNKGRIIALFVPKAVAPQALDALSRGGFVEIELLREKGNPADLKKAIGDRKGQLSARLAALQEELESLNKQFAKFILAAEELLSIDTQKAEAPLRFATSENAFIIDGWVPVRDFQKLRAGLAEATGGRVYVTQIEPEHKGYAAEAAVGHGPAEHHEVNAPVAYDNPRFMEPAQVFIDMFSRPKYSEIDPTPIFFLLFPIFYGFILGDVGYGLLLLIAAVALTYVFRRSPGMQALTKTLVFCSFSSIVFGFIFGEFLGYSLAHYLPALYPQDVVIGPLGPFALPLERMVAGGFEEKTGAYVFGIKDLLVLTCLVGVAHLTLGYLIGFRNEFRMHGLKMAVFHKLSWLMMLFGGVAVIWYLFPLMISGNIGAAHVSDPLFIAGIALFVFGLILLLIGEGPISILEIPNLMSNVLSYTRLLAVGLSSVGIAFAIQIMVGMLFSAGPLGWVVGAIVFLLGHTINLLLGIIAPGLHALRLHYVEFFTKFYKGGGRIYSPFGYLRKYTEE